MTLSIILGLFACGNADKDTDTDPTQNDTGVATDASMFDSIVYVDTPPIGDMACFAEGYSDSWAEQSVGEEVVTDISISGTAAGAFFGEEFAELTGEQPVVMDM
mgnify:CR=1 FL=1